MKFPLLVQGILPLAHIVFLHFSWVRVGVRDKYEPDSGASTQIQI